MAATFDIGAVPLGGSRDIGAVELAPSVEGNPSIMTTNTGYWGPTFIFLLGLLALLC